MRKLADLLISGRLAPGEKLSLRAAADVLGVSIMPVREAVSRLVADKALEVTPNRAVRVPLMSAAQFRDLTKVRIAIEGHAAAQAAAAPRQQRPRVDRARRRSDAAGERGCTRPICRARSNSTRPFISRSMKRRIRRSWWKSSARSGSRPGR